MERFYLDHGRYDNAAAHCGVTPPADTEFLSFSCRTSGTSYTATLHGIGALAGYEYVLDDSARPQRTLQFEGAPVSKNCWLTHSGNC
jgi:hypothetical protein